MGIFDKLIGRKPQGPDDGAEERQFDEEWRQALTRFGIVTGLGNFALALKHPETGVPMPPHAGLGQTFGEWKPIQAPYDRRALLFDLIAGMVGKSLSRWQTANYLTATRSPDKALALLEQAPEAETTSAQFQAAAARALLGLGRPAEALVHAARAMEAAPDEARTRALYADALHLHGRCEEAHVIYQALMASGPAPDGAAPAADQFAAFFSQETGRVPSPVLALDVVEGVSDPARAEEFWRLGETEFYDSPYFRMHHAYHLADAGQTERAVAKLIALVKEMPWLREPSLNLSLFFEKLDPTGQKIMPEFQAQLRRTIQSHGWTTEGMRPKAIGPGG